MNASPKDVMVFIDTLSKHYYRDHLFQDDAVLRRDNCLSPLNRLGGILEKIEG